MGAVDNILRPILVGKDTRLPDWVVLISTLGGVSVFGINGFVIGPLIAALFVSCWDISVMDDSDERTIPERVKRLEREADVASQTVAEVSTRKS
jgi:predicted PurR-regulated permease PerM